jgi:hypothetical protein
MASEIGGGGVSELSDLSDVNTSTPSNRFALVADGVDFESRLLVEADISNLQSYLTSEVNDLSAAVTWANIPDANVPASAVTQHEAALTIIEGQITGAAFTNWNTAYTRVNTTGEFSATFKRNIAQYNRWGAVQDMAGTTDWDEGVYGGYGTMTNGPTGMTYDPFLVMGSASDVRSFLMVPRTASRAIAYKGSYGTGATHTAWHYAAWTTTAADAQLSLYAKLASPNFSGTPQISSVNIATVNTNWDAGDITTGTLAVLRGGTGVTTKTGTGNVVLSASPALTGSPTAPTQSAGDNSTKVATTAYVDAAAGGPQVILKTADESVKVSLIQPHCRMIIIWFRGRT